jgi:hypothetical protein
MSSASLRRTDRVSLTLLLEASGKNAKGEEFKLPSRTLLINRGGAVIVLDQDLAAEQFVHLQRRAPHESHRKGQVRVVGQFGRERDGYLYGIEVPDASMDLWGVEFPPIAESTEAVARMLLECTYCRSREVVHMNELELRAFETNRGIARHCKTCGVPSIWTQAPHEDEDKLTPRKRRGADGAGAIPESGDKRERERMRLKTRRVSGNRGRTTNWLCARIFHRSECVSAASAATNQTRRSTSRCRIRPTLLIFFCPRAWSIQSRCRRLACSVTARNTAASGRGLADPDLSVARLWR